MKMTELDIGELIEAFGVALVPMLYEGVDRQTPAHTVRERARLNAEIMGRVAAVLYCGERVGPDIGALIELFTTHMRTEHLRAMDRFLGPGGSLSRLEG